MTHIPHPFGQRTLARALAVTLATALVCTSALAQTGRVASRTGDFIVAVVNTELVTSVELQQRLDRIQADAQREGARLPDAADAAPAGARRADRRAGADHPCARQRPAGRRGDIDRAMQASRRRTSSPSTQLRDRLKPTASTTPRFRSNLRDQMHGRAHA
jgi:peptidyl-prolyl cis-trans isomerase SurA